MTFEAEGTWYSHGIGSDADPKNSIRKVEAERLDFVDPKAGINDDGDRPAKLNQERESHQGLRDLYAARTGNQPIRSER